MPSCALFKGISKTSHFFLSRSSPPRSVTMFIEMKQTDKPFQCRQTRACSGMIGLWNGFWIIKLLWRERKKCGKHSFSAVLPFILVISWINALQMAHHLSHISSAVFRRFFLPRLLWTLLRILFSGWNTQVFTLRVYWMNEFRRQLFNYTSEFETSLTRRKCDLWNEKRTRKKDVANRPSINLYMYSKQFIVKISFFSPHPCSPSLS